MTQSNSIRLAELEDLLEREREMLRVGNIQGLTRLTRRKERLVSRLRKTDQKRSELQRLTQMANRNAELLKAALDGIKSVHTQLRALRTGPANVQTYASDGALEDLTRRKHNLEKRA